MNKPINNQPYFGTTFIHERPQCPRCHSNDRVKAVPRVFIHNKKAFREWICGGGCQVWFMIPDESVILNLSGQKKQVRV